MVALTAMNTCSRARPRSGPAPAKGPSPACVARLATAYAAVVTVTVAAGPKRNAAQKSSGKKAYSENLAAGPWPAKKRALAASMPPSRAAPSTAAPRRRGSASLLVQAKSTGAITSAPRASPSHQSQERSGSTRAGWTPPSPRLAMPIEALTSGLAAAAPRSASTSRIRASLPSKPAHRSKLAPARASRVLPNAMPAATVAGSAVVTLARKAPRNTPGSARRPSFTVAASARPVGGQIALTCCAWTENTRPSLAASR